MDLIKYATFIDGSGERLVNEIDALKIAFARMVTDEWSIDRGKERTIIHFLDGRYVFALSGDEWVAAVRPLFQAEQLLCN